MRGRPSDYKSLSDLNTATSFLAFGHYWCIGGNIDAAAWWVDKGGCGHRRVLITGETIDFTPPKVVADQITDPDTVHALIAQFCALGGERLTPQLSGSAPWSNFDRWYGVKRSAHDEALWIPVVTGYHDTQEELDRALDEFFGRLVPEFRNNE